MLALALLDPPRLELTERWAFSMPSPGNISNQGTLEVAGGRAFYLETSINDDGGVGCLDLRTGRLLWHLDKGETGAKRLVLQGGHLVVKQNEAIAELDPATGKALWTLKVEPYHMGPFVVGDTLVAETRAGALRAFDLRTHRPLWSLDYPSEFRGYTRNGAAAVVGGALWTEAADGQVLKVALTDGRLLFRRPSGLKAPYGIVPMGQRIAILSSEGTAVWRSADGTAVWSGKGGSEGSGFYAAARDELWRSDWLDGQLLRYRAADGTRIGPPVSLGGPYASLGAPRPWGAGYLLATSRGVRRLDAEGRTVGEYGAGESFTEAVPLGTDVVARSFERVVRLRPGRPPTPKDPQAEARRLLSKSVWSTTQRLALERLGRAAIPAILAALKEPVRNDKGALRSVLLDVADARDTVTLFPLAEQVGTFTRESTFENGGYRDWMSHKTDPEWLAVRLLPRLKAAKNDDEAQRWIFFMDRSSDRAVVDELFRRLRSPASSPGLKGMIYASIAASGRPEVLDYILRTRAQGRRLAKAIPGLSTTKDTDGDGIPDAYDANPYVAPRPLSEKERIMGAAFDAFARFDSRDEPLMDVGYGPGVRPFELLGWSGGLRPLKADFTRKPGEFPWGLSFETFSADGDVVRLEPGGQEATVRIARRYGYGTEERLRKMRGEWFVVSLRGTWVN